MKLLRLLITMIVFQVAPVRERGLKYQHMFDQQVKARRSREGAWIEISFIGAIGGFAAVAPVRERGLKFARCQI